MVREIECIRQDVVGRLETCIKTKSLEQVAQVHFYALRNGIKLRMSQNTRLIDVYAKRGRMDMAWQVFETMPKRDVVTWNALIAGYAGSNSPNMALELSSKMMEVDGVVPDVITFVSLLKACSRLESFPLGQNVHQYMIKIGIQQDTQIGNTLIDMYLKSGSTTDAYHVFAGMPSHNVVSWTAMMSSYVRNGCPAEALKLFYEMKEKTIVPDEISFLNVFIACGKAGDLKKGKQLHASLLETDIQVTGAIANALLDMYIKCRSIDWAIQIFNGLFERDVICWTSIISGYVDNNQSDKALNMYEKMYRCGVMPNEVTFLIFLKACADLAALNVGEEIHALIIKTGTKLNLHLESTLIHMYSNCGCMDAAWDVFLNISDQDSIAWNAIITGYHQQDHVLETFRLFKQMIQEGITPDRTTLTTVLNACASMASLYKGREIHLYIIHCRFLSDPFVGSALIDMYFKCGDIRSAENTFKELQNRDIVLWTVLITGYSLHGFQEKVLRFSQKIIQENIQLNEVSFLQVLSACSHTGLVEEGSNLLSLMCNSIRARVNHYTCIVDLFGRAGSLDRAECVINYMPFIPTTESWMALYGSCR